ncbi:MAG: indole-3-glycerol phosphate synthase TrpC [Sediminibacterium sp.]|nr:indole-3-glycerol phosphate synthase TrpC [Sediminibacterium sp.]
MSTNILAKIVEHKLVEVAERKKQMTVAQLEAMPLFAKQAYSLKTNLLDPSLTGIIAEFKRQSPSKGVINDKALVADVTKAYTQFGAAGISVLTDTHFFGGHLADLSVAVQNAIPVLRKEFIVDEFQLVEAKAYGASVILLIAACLTPQETKSLAAFAKSVGLEVLLEIHDATELGHITDEVDFVGINNRSLKSFEVNIEHSLQLKDQLPKGKLSIAESGIYSVDTFKLLKQEGFDGFLMGEYFMKQEDPATAFEAFVKLIKTDSHAV